MKNKAKPFFVDTTHFLTHASVILMALSAILRLLGSFGMWGDPFRLITQIAVPLTGSLLFILLLMLFGNKALFLTGIPVVMFTVYSVISSIGSGFITVMICIILYCSAAVIFCCTTAGMIRTKLFVLLLYVLVFGYSIAIRSSDLIADISAPVSFSVIMSETADFFMYTAVFLLCLAMKNRRTLEESGLPKIRAPRVLIRKAETQEPEAVVDSSAALSDDVREDSPEPVSDTGGTAEVSVSDADTQPPVSPETIAENDTESEEEAAD